MLSAPRSWIRLLLLLGAMLAMGSMAAQAREGFYLGAGLVAVSSSGDLKGTHFVTNAAGTEADVLDRRPGVYSEADQAEDRRRVLSYDFTDKGVK